VCTRWDQTTVGLGEQIRQCPGVLAFVFGDSPIALMNGEADLVDFLPSIIIGLMRFVTIALAM